MQDTEDSRDKNVELLSLIHKDKRTAIRLLYDNYYQTLSLFACQLVHDPDVAEDVVHDLFVRMWTTKNKVPVATPVDVYLFQAVKYASLNHIRNTQRRRIIDRRLYDEAMAEQARLDVEAEEFEAIYKAINQLPEKRREIFVLVYIDGLKYQEVADRMEVSVSTVKTQIARSIKHLRQVLCEDDFLLMMIFFKKN